MQAKVAQNKISQMRESRIIDGDVCEVETQNFASLPKNPSLGRFSGRDISLNISAIHPSYFQFVAHTVAKRVSAFFNSLQMLHAKFYSGKYTFVVRCLSLRNE